MLKIINVKNLMKLSPLDVFHKMRGNFNIRFEDGNIINLSRQELSISMYYWSLLQTLDMPIDSKYRLLNFCSNGLNISDAHMGFYSKVYKDYFKDYLEAKNKITFTNMEKAWVKMFDILNVLYTEFQEHIQDYGVSLSILDYKELAEDEDLTKAREEALKDPRNPEGIDKVKEAVDKVMLKYPKNNLSVLYNSGAANKTQVGHGVGLRGFVADINNRVYPEMVKTNLLEGFNDFTSLASEQAVMARALKLQVFGVKYSEWLQRELHLATMHMIKLDLGDCGNHDYVPYLVENKKSLKLLEGAYILLDGEEVELDLEKHNFPIGTVLQYRRVNECNFLDDGRVCRKCLGGISASIAEGDNIAHSLITEMMAVFGQMMLSAKHYTESTKLKDIILSNVAKKYFELRDEDYYVSSKLDRSKTVRMIIDPNSYHGFRLLTSSTPKEAARLNTVLLSHIDTIRMDYDGYDVIETVKIRTDGRPGILDHSLVVHSLTNTTIDEHGNYVIDITDYKGRILYLEEKEFAFDVFNTDFKILINKAGRPRGIDVDEMIKLVFNFVNQKLEINIKIIEVLIAGLTIKDKKAGNYGVGTKNDVNRTVSSYASVINNRSVGIAIGFQNQKAIIKDPNRYVYKPQPYNPIENVWNFKNIIWKTKGKI